VSTDKQTVKSQLEPCKDYCLKNKYEVVDVFKEKSKSAYHNVKRPVYDKVLDLVRRREIQHVVVWALDRWTRKGSKDLRETIDYLMAYGVQLHSVQEAWLDTINIPGVGHIVKDFLTGLVGWMAEEESRLKSERVKSSKKFQKAKKKHKVGRPKLSNDVKQRVAKLLQEGKTYKYIQDNVMYKAKYGKFKHVSAPTISEIKKSLLEKGNIKNKGKKSSSS